MTRDRMPAPGGDEAGGRERIFAMYSGRDFGLTDGAISLPP
jgi:hypothetical protein